MTFDELVAILPVISHPPPITSGGGFRYVDLPPDGFTPPPIDVVRGCTWEQTGLLLVEAPAATGKTAVAEALAAATRAPVWDLSQVDVGKSTLTGELYDLVGGSAVDRFIGSDDATPDLAIVLDALDEAQLRVTEGGFVAFLENVALRLGRPTGSCRAVLLARGETATFIALHLELLNVPVFHVTIGLFDEDDAREFVRGRIRSRAKRRGDARSIVETRASFFESRLTEVFNAIARGMTGADADWSDPEVQKFLGYAPVLQAVADSLEDDEVNAAAPIPDAAGEMPNVWKLLMQISADVLRREQVKTVGRVRDRLGFAAEPLGFSDWESLYTPDEQVRLVTEWVLNQGLDPDTALLPNEVALQYREIVRDMIPQHAFAGESRLGSRQYANLVFEQYAAATVLLRGDTAAKAKVAERLANRLPDPLLGRFIANIADDSHVDGSAFGFIYESLLESAQLDAPVHLYVIEPREAQEREIVLAFDSGDQSGEIRFATASSGIEFGNRVALTNVSVAACDIRLGRPDGTLVIGPNVHIQAARVVVASRDVRVTARGTPIYVEAAEFSSVAPHTNLRVDGEGFGIGARDLKWPFSNHEMSPLPELMQEIADGIRSGQEEEAVILYVCRILQRFSGSAAADRQLRRGKLIIDNVATGGSPLGRSVRDFMLADGLVIDVSSKQYALGRDRLGQRGISFSDISRRRVNAPALRQLAIDFRAWSGGSQGS